MEKLAGQIEQLERDTLAAEGQLNEAVADYYGLGVRDRAVMRQFLDRF